METSGSSVSCCGSSRWRVLVLQWARWQLSCLLGPNLKSLVMPLLPCRIGWNTSNSTSGFMSRGHNPHSWWGECQSCILEEHVRWKIPFWPPWGNTWFAMARRQATTVGVPSSSLKLFPYKDPPTPPHTHTSYSRYIFLFVLRWGNLAQHQPYIP